MDDTEMISINSKTTKTGTKRKHKKFVMNTGPYCSCGKNSSCGKPGYCFCLLNGKTCSPNLCNCTVECCKNDSSPREIIQKNNSKRTPHSRRPVRLHTEHAQIAFSPTEIVNDKALNITLNADAKTSMENLETDPTNLKTEYQNIMYAINNIESSILNESKIDLSNNFNSI